MRLFHLTCVLTFRPITLVALLFVVLVPMQAVAGELNAPPAPNHTDSAMFSIEAIYQRLLNGAAGDKRGGTPGTFKEPAGAPGSTMHTLNDVMGVAPAKDTVDGASPDQVVTGKKFWGLKDGAGWGLLGGTMPMAVITADSTQVKGGYIATTTLTAIDADLTTDNIKAGTTIFGVTGKTEVADTTSGDAVAADLQAGKKAWVDGSEVTGIRCGGVVIDNPDPARWSANRRWYDNGDGTVSDTTTGLIWTKDACMFGVKKEFFDANVQVAWWGTPPSDEGASWRLPTLPELRSLTTGVDPVSSGNTQLFTNVKGDDPFDLYLTITFNEHGMDPFYDLYGRNVFTQVEGPIMGIGHIWPVRNP